MNFSVMFFEISGTVSFQMPSANPLELFSKLFFCEFHWQLLWIFFLENIKVSHFFRMFWQFLPKQLWKCIRQLLWEFIFDTYSYCFRVLQQFFWKFLSPWFWKIVQILLSEIPVALEAPLEISIWMLVEILLFQCFDKSMGVLFRFFFKNSFWNSHEYYFNNISKFLWKLSGKLP